MAGLALVVLKMLPGAGLALALAGHALFNTVNDVIVSASRVVPLAAEQRRVMASVDGGLAALSATSWLTATAAPAVSFGAAAVVAAFAAYYTTAVYVLKKRL